MLNKLNKHSYGVFMYYQTMKNKTWHARLSYAMKMRGVKIVDLANALGIKQPSVSYWLSGETKNMRGIYVSKVCNYLGIPPEWLFSGEGDFQQDRAISTVEARALNNKNTGDKVIHQYDAIGAMGSGVVLKDQSGVIRSFSVNQEWLRLNIRNATSYDNLRIVTGFGDSMRGMFNSGDPLIIDVGVKAVDYDAVYFFRVGDEGFIKRLQRIPGIGLRAISENKAYDSWEINKSMDFEVFGRVLKVWQGADY